MSVNVLKRVRAFLFDLDGTLVDNMPFHKQSWIDIFQRHGRPLDPDEFLRATSGRHGGEIVRDYFGIEPDDPANRRLNEEKEERYRELYGPHRQMLSGLRELLDQADAAGVKMAVATSAPHDNVAFVLDHLGIRTRFAAVVGPEDVGRGKPDPAVFLAAAGRLCVEPRECLVFEDALLGVEAARRAGMFCVAITTSLPQQAFYDKSNVVAVASTFAALRFDELVSPVPTLPRPLPG